MLILTCCPFGTDAPHRPLKGYPWWPAVIVPCNQRKHRWADQFRIGGEDPSIAKFWVQFVNENSGAFVWLKHIVPFNPLELNKYACEKTHSFFKDQKKAIEMARDDFYVMHPNFPRRADEASFPVPEENVGTANADSEGDAKAAGKKSAHPAKRKPTKIAPANGAKAKRARVTKPDTQEFGPVSSESGEEADPEDVPMSVAHEVGNAYVPNDERAGDALLSDDAILAPSYTRKPAKASSAKKSTKAVASKDAKKQKAAAADKQKIKSLQRQLEAMRAELDEEKTAHDSSRRRAADLERKLKKARHARKSVEKVKVLLPEVPDALPAEIPLESERASNKLDAGEFHTLGGQTHGAFSEYEALVKQCGGLHTAVLGAAKAAEAQLQGSWNEMAASMTRMEELERRLAGHLRALYCADIRCDNGPDEALMQTVTKIVKRIHRRVRVGDNSGLVLGRAHAVIESWEEEASKTHPTAEASEKAMKDEPKVSGVSPEANLTSAKEAPGVGMQDSKTLGKDVVDGHVDTQEKDSLSSDDHPQVGKSQDKESEGEGKSACMRMDNEDSKEEGDDEKQKEDERTGITIGDKDDGKTNTEDFGGDKSGSVDIERSVSHEISSEGNQFVSTTAPLNAMPEDEKQNGEGDENDAAATNERRS